MKLKCSSLLWAVFLLQESVVFGQDDYNNYEVDYGSENYNYPDDNGSDPGYDPCYFYDNAHEENGNCTHEAFPNDKIVEEKKCCKGHKYMFHDHCHENDGKLMCGDPNKSNTAPVHLSHAMKCPKNCSMKLLGPGRTV